MPLNPVKVTEFLASYEAGLGAPGRLVVAFSGGRDSTVLLHLLSTAGTRNLLAVHINHELHDDAADWARHCEAVAAALGVPFVAVTVDVATQGGDGLEANARHARYAALSELMDADDWVLTAHHRDDQAETLLLNLLRGSGASGLRGIAPARPLGPGWLLRPLLLTSAADIADYARGHALVWVDDPSNADARHDRNFLRASVLPVLQRRWPAVARTLAHSATLARETADILADTARSDMAACGPAGRLSVAGLQALSPARQRNLLRHAAADLGLPSPPAKQLQAIVAELLPARGDGSPQVSWRGGEARRYRGQLYLMPPLSAVPAAPLDKLFAGGTLSLPAAYGELGLEPGTDGGIRTGLAQSGLDVRFREGGERLRPAGQAHHKPLKKLLQEAAVLPWMRDRIPLLYAGTELVAVADLWIAAEHHDTAGLGVRWQGGPSLR